DMVAHAGNRVAPLSRENRGDRASARAQGPGSRPAQSSRLHGSHPRACGLVEVAAAQALAVRGLLPQSSPLSPDENSRSAARAGKKPRLIRNLWRGLALLLSNLLVFMPRRPVNMILEHVGRDRLPEPRREVLNPWLEKWYNQDGPETPTFIPYHFLFGRRTYEFPAHPGSAEVDLGAVKAETRTAIAGVLARKLNRALTDDEQKPS